MNTSMPVPTNWKEFLQDYSFKDIEQIYTNGLDLIPVFRVEQMMEQHQLKKEMRYEAKIQELEQKLKDMTENRDWWRKQCKEFYKDYKVLSDKIAEVMADRLAELFPTQGVKL